MTENILTIEPQRGLGFIKLESNINFILTELKSRGDKLQNADIVIGESNFDPIYVVLSGEGIRLRFDGCSQKLELIEISVKHFERHYTIFYKGDVIIQGNGYKSMNNSMTNTLHGNTNTYNLPHITYNFINSLFGPSDIPKLIDNGKFLLLRYDGISFIFDNLNIQSEDTIILGTDAALNKIVIFRERNLIESIVNPNFNGILNINTLNNNIKESIFNRKSSSNYYLSSLRIDIEKGFIFSSSVYSGVSTNTNNLKTNLNQSSRNSEDKIHNEEILISPYLNEKSIAFGEGVESVLYKLQNPNYIFYKKAQDLDIDSYDYIDADINRESPTSYYFVSDSNTSEETDYFLNYYSLGIDILIDGLTNTCKKFVFHTNSPIEAGFGIYNRCNFTIELNKSFFKKINDAGNMINNNNIIGNNLSYNNYNESNQIQNYNSSPRSRKISEDSAKLYFNSEGEKDSDVTLNSRNNNVFIVTQNQNYMNNEGINEIIQGNIFFINKMLLVESFDILSGYNSNSNQNSLRSMINISNTNGVEKDKETNQLSYKDSYFVNLINSGEINKQDDLNINNNMNSFSNTTTNNINTSIKETGNTNTNNNYHSQLQKKRKITSNDVDEKSFGSISESNLSISLNNSDIFSGVLISPTTNFSEIISKIPNNSYYVYHKHEDKLNCLIRFYVFDGIIFEVLENYSISRVTLFRSSK